MLLMIDNYDSFTYNLVQYLQELNVNINVFYNNKITLPEIDRLNPERIVLSPGPGNPDQAGITLAVIEMFAGNIPMLGVCLGHQAIAQAFGANIVLAKEVMHGKTSQIYHTGVGVFSDLPNPFTATRYHSLVIDADSLSEEFEITAWTQDAQGRRQDIMGIRHKTKALEGVQFHPESIMSEHGHALLKNFLRL